MHFINLHTHHATTSTDSISIYNNRISKTFKTDSLFSIGIHPWDIEDIDVDKDFELLNQIVKHKNCIAIGECGIDKLITTNLKTQQLIFVNQIQIAIQNRKPVIIHCVKAFDELIEITKPYRNQIPFIIHGFNKSTELANSLINKGFYLSLSPNVFNKSGINLSRLPLSKLFLETDDNENVTIEHCYNQLAKKLNMSLDALKTEINFNFETVFYGTK